MSDGKQPASLQGCRVLVLEDEYFIADDLATALGALGARVVGPVPDVAGAMDLIQSGERIDLAVLDLNVRGELAYPIADVLMTKRVPFVFATGYGAALIPPGYGEVPRWEKPYNHRDLARMLPTLLPAAEG